MWRRFRLPIAAVVSLLFSAEACARPPRHGERKPAASPSAAPAARAVHAPPVYDSATLYGAALHVPKAFDKATLADALGVFGNMTGHVFATQEGASESGIALLRTDLQEAQPAEVQALAGKGPEAFSIRSSDPRSLRIVANSDAGLIQGLYFYLRELGCRWLLPGRAWTIIPSRDDIGLRIDRVVVPDRKSVV